MKKERVENLKSALIMLLLIVIVGILVDQIYLVKNDGFDDAEITVSTKNLLYPKNIYYAFGDGNYVEDYMVNDEAILILQNGILEGINKQDVDFSKVDNDEVNRAIKLNYDFGISLIDAININELSGSYTDRIPQGKLTFINVVLLPRKKLLVGIGDEIYEIKGKNGSFPSLFQYASNIIFENEYDDESLFFRNIRLLESLKNLDVVNENIALPVKLKGALDIYQVQSEAELSDVSSINKVVSNVFGVSKSFVKKLKTKTGELVYIYNYGEKQLKFSNDGTITYELIGIDEEGIESDFNRSLLIALSFIEKVSGNAENLILSEYREDEKDKTKYIYKFISPMTKYRNTVSNIGVRVVVKNNEVVEFVRKMPKVISVEYKKEKTAITDFEKLSRVISNSHFKNMISLEYVKNEGISPKDDRYQDLYVKAIGGIDGFYIDYYLSGYKSLRPAYVFTMGNSKFIVDYYIENLIEVIR